MTFRGIIGRQFQLYFFSMYIICLYINILHFIYFDPYFKPVCNFLWLDPPLPTSTVLLNMQKNMQVGGGRDCQQQSCFYMYMIQCCRWACRLTHCYRCIYGLCHSNVVKKSHTCRKVPTLDNKRFTAFSLHKFTIFCEYHI